MKHQIKQDPKEVRNKKDQPKEKTPIIIHFEDRRTPKKPNPFRPRGGGDCA